MKLNKILAVIFTFLSISIIIIGHMFTRDMTEVNALLFGWQFWIAGGLCGCVALLLVEIGEK